MRSYRNILKLLWKSVSLASEMVLARIFTAWFMQRDSKLSRDSYHSDNNINDVDRHEKKIWRGNKH
jgi:hypothetical protein